MKFLVVFVACLLSSVMAMTVREYFKFSPHFFSLVLYRNTFQYFNTQLQWPGIPVAHNEKCSTLGRIVNGMQAKDYQFPWYVTVRSHTLDGLQSICGGSIVSPIWILTAAHCTHDFISYTIGFGSNRLNAPLITMHTYDVVEHVHYNSDNLNNDIAMIKLPSPLTFSPIIQSIRLPKLSETGADAFLYAKAQVCGYGRTDERMPTIRSSVSGDFTNICDFYFYCRQ